MAIDNLEGTMMEGVEVEVKPGDVARTVVEIAGSGVKKGTEFIRKHPNEIRIALMAAVGAIALLVPEVARAQGPSATPILPELRPIDSEQIRGAAQVLTGGREPATTALNGLVTAVELGTKTAAQCK